jgi:hypothetical protein
MLPTYSFSEIKNIIRSFDLTEIELLNDLVHEEIDCYVTYESRAIFRLILVQKKAISRNEVQLEYLLAYN